MKSLRKILLALFIATLLMVAALANTGTKTVVKDEKFPVLRIGYFHGGRTMLAYRALINDYFNKEKLNAIFVTKKLRATVWESFDSKSGEAAMSGPKVGKATGIELNELMFKGQADMAFIGEAAFVRSCVLGEPIVAIAQLGADDQGKGGHTIVIKKGIKINGPKDLEKLVWGSRRSSGGDDIFLKEFLLKEGVDLTKVKFILGIDDDKMGEYMKSGKIQGAYYHLMSVRNEEREGIIYTYRKLDWINPAISQSLAVVSRTYFDNNKDEIKRFLRGYMKRIAYEHSLPKHLRRRAQLDSTKKVYTKYLYELEMDYKGMNLPQYPKIPSVRKALMDEGMDMLFRHNFIAKKVDMQKCYDNSLIKEVALEMYPKETMLE